MLMNLSRESRRVFGVDSRQRMLKKSPHAGFFSYQEFNDVLVCVLVASCPITHSPPQQRKTRLPPPQQQCPTTKSHKYSRSAPTTKQGVPGHKQPVSAIGPAAFLNITAWRFGLMAQAPRCAPILRAAWQSCRPVVDSVQPVFCLSHHASPSFLLFYFL